MFQGTYQTQFRIDLKVVYGFINVRDAGTIPRSFVILSTDFNVYSTLPFCE